MVNIFTQKWHFINEKFLHYSEDRVSKKKISLVLHDAFLNKPENLKYVFAS